MEGRRSTRLRTPITRNQPPRDRSSQNKRCAVSKIPKPNATHELLNIPQLNILLHSQHAVVLSTPGTSDLQAVGGSVEEQPTKVENYVHQLNVSDYPVAFLPAPASDHQPVRDSVDISHTRITPATQLIRIYREIPSPEYEPWVPETTALPVQDSSSDLPQNNTTFGANPQCSDLPGLMSFPQNLKWQSELREPSSDVAQRSSKRQKRELTEDKLQQDARQSTERLDALAHLASLAGMYYHISI